MADLIAALSNLDMERRTLAADVLVRRCWSKRPATERTANAFGAARAWFAGERKAVRDDATLAALQRVRDSWASFATDEIPLEDAEAFSAFIRTSLANSCEPIDTAHGDEYATTLLFRSAAQYSGVDWTNRPNLMAQQVFVRFGEHLADSVDSAGREPGVDRLLKIHKFARRQSDVPGALFSYLIWLVADADPSRFRAPADLERPALPGESERLVLRDPDYVTAALTAVRDKDARASAAFRAHSRAESELSRAQSAVSEYERIVNQGPSDLAGAKSQVASARYELESATQSLSDARESEQRARERLADCESELRSVQSDERARVQGLSVSAEGLNRDAHDAESTLEALRSDLQMTQRELDDAERRIQRSDEPDETERQERDRLNYDVKRLTSDVAMAQDRLRYARERSESAQLEVDEAKRAAQRREEPLITQVGSAKQSKQQAHSATERASEHADQARQSVRRLEERIAYLTREIPDAPSNLAKWKPLLSAAIDEEKSTASKESIAKGHLRKSLDQLRAARAQQRNDLDSAVAGFREQVEVGWAGAIGRAVALDAQSAGLLYEFTDEALVSALHAVCEIASARVPAALSTLASGVGFTFLGQAARSGTRQELDREIAAGPKAGPDGYEAHLDRDRRADVIAGTFALFFEADEDPSIPIRLAGLQWTAPQNVRAAWEKTRQQASESVAAAAPAADTAAVSSHTPTKTGGSSLWRRIVTAALVAAVLVGLGLWMRTLNTSGSRAEPALVGAEPPIGGTEPGVTSEMAAYYRQAMEYNALLSSEAVSMSSELGSGVTDTEYQRVTDLRDSIQQLSGDVSSNASTSQRDQNLLKLLELYKERAGCLVLMADASRRASAKERSAAPAPWASDAQYNQQLKKACGYYQIDPHRNGPKNWVIIKGGLQYRVMEAFGDPPSKTTTKRN